MQPNKWSLLQPTILENCLVTITTRYLQSPDSRFPQGYANWCTW